MCFSGGKYKYKNNTLFKNLHDTREICIIGNVTLRHEGLEDGKNKGRTFRYGLFMQGGKSYFTPFLS